MQDKRIIEERRIYKMKQKEIKKLNNKGITLIALVITIIVLLILAGVSIAMLTGENGILTQAQRAKEQTSVAEEKELIALAYNAAVTKKQSTDVEAKDLNDEFEASDVNAEASGNIIVYFKDTQRYYTVENGVVEGPTTEKPETALTLVAMFENGETCDKKDGTCTDETHLHIGDYVNYNPGTSGSYTSTGANTGMEQNGSGFPDEIKNQVFNVDNSTTWRVLGVEGEGNNKHILLVSGSPIKKETTSNDPYYYLYSAWGYKNAETELNNICAIYGKGKGAESARSLTAEDINKICGVTVVSETEIKPDGVNEDSSYGQTHSYTNQFANEDDFIAGTRSDFTKTSDAYYYSGDNPALVTANNKRLYDMIFYPSGNEQDKKEYWLASRCVGTNSDICYFYVGAVFEGAAGPEGSYLFYSSGNGRLRSYAVRPVVSLESNVSIDTIQKIEDQQEEDWSIYDRISG